MLANVIGNFLFGGSVTSAASIVGDSFVGSMLTTSGGGTYQWQKNGVDIGGETHSYYTTVAGDEGANITVKVNNIPTTAVVPQWSPASFGNSLVLWLNPSNMTAMLQEQPVTSVPITPVGVNNDPVGMIYDMGFHGYLMQAEADTRRPLLGSDGSRNNFLTWDGVNDYIRVVNTAKYLAPLHAAAPVWTLMFWFKSGADGTQQWLFNSNANTTSNAGLAIQKTAANKIAVDCTFASAGNHVFNFTSTPTITTASGWTAVILTINGVGASTGSLQIGNNAAETFAVAAGAAVNATNDLFIGCLVGPATFMNGSFGDIVFTKTAVTAGDVTKFKAYNPARTIHTFNPILQWNIDYNQSGFVWNDTAFSVAITDGATIQGVQSAVTSIFGNTNRTLTSASAPTSPVWRQVSLNGNATAEYTGASNQNLTFIEALTKESGGIWTLYIVSKNTTSTPGSHPISGGGLSTNYIPTTGSAYAGNNLFSPPKNYNVIHTETETPGANPLGNQGDVYNIFIVRRNGSNWTTWNTNGDKIVDTGTGKFIIDATGSASTSQTTAWNMNGNICLIKKYVGGQVDDQVNDNRLALKTRFAI